MRNAFRNPLRTISVVAILGISLGMIVVMLAARSAVDSRIAEVKTSIGTIVNISPAGARGFLGGGEPLTNAQLDDVRTVAHVDGVDATIDAQLATTDTSLKSAIEAGTLGGRGFRAFRSNGSTGGSVQGEEPPAGFTPPIFVVGTSNANYGGSLVGSNLKITAGEVPDMSGDAKAAVIGKNLAEKNSLSVGSTFTAYGETVTITAIYDAGNDFANNSVAFPLKTMQALSDQIDQVTSAQVRVDSADNLAVVTSAISTKLGTKADVTSSQEQVDEAVKPLNNIRTIATTSLFGALIAGAVITLLTMVMIVRERRKEIAVLKAVGAGDGTIVGQFVTESVTLAMMGSVIGTILGFILSNPILSALLRSSNEAPTVGGGPGREIVGGAPIRIAVGGFRAVQGAVRDLQAVVNIELILYGLAAAIVIAIIGSAFPAWLISRVRPAEVLRSE